MPYEDQTNYEQGYRQQGMLGRKRADSDDEIGPGTFHEEKKRSKTEYSEIEERLENLILKVGEKSSSSLESNLEGLANVLEADLANYKIRILKILAECVECMPEKLTIYSTLVGLLNAKNYNFGGELVELMLRTLRERIKQSEFTAAIVIMMFLCDLVNCRVVSCHSCLAFLDAFVEVTLEKHITQARSDWFIYAVLCALPWVGRELYEKKPDELDDILGAVENYISKRTKLHVPILRVWSSAKPHPQEEYMDCLWAQICKLRLEKWVERHIIRPYLAFDAVLCDALQHNIQNFAVPSHNERMRYPLPCVIYRMFDYTDCPEEGPVLPGAHSIERFLIETELSWTLQKYYLDRKECATMLLAYPRRAKVPLNYMILEVVFGHMFKLPTAPHLQLCYGALLIELCKLEPNTMPQCLAQAAEMLYQRIETMSVVCFDRFVDWFSYHLSQFQFHWSWDEWTDCLEADAVAPRHLFVKEVLQKCMRLSYHQRVQEIVPSSFVKMVPPKPAENYKYSQDGAESLPGTTIARQLAQAIRNKCTPEEALFTIKDCPTPIGVDVEEAGFNPLKIEVLLATLLHLGNTSFSHSLAALAKYHYTLKALTEGNEEAQQCVLQAMYDHWSNYPQMLIVLVDKLLKMQIVECTAVVDWLFSDQMQQDFTAMFIWEILQSTLYKMSKFIEKLRAESVEAQEKFATQQKVKQNKKADGGMDVEDEDCKPDDPADGEVSEEVLEQLEEELESSCNEQKNLFLLIFQKIIIILTQHLVESEAEGKDYNTNWYRWVAGRMKQIFLTHSDDIWKYAGTLESLLFTNDVDPHILEIFHQFCSLKK